MELKYKINGMSCSHCQARVEKALNSIDGVQAIVSLTPPEAVINSNKEVDLTILQNQLSDIGDYSIEFA